MISHATGPGILRTRVPRASRLSMLPIALSFCLVPTFGSNNDPRPLVSVAPPDACALAQSQLELNCAATEPAIHIDDKPAFACLTSSGSIGDRLVDDSCIEGDVVEADPVHNGSPKPLPSPGCRDGAAMDAQALGVLAALAAMAALGISGTATPQTAVQGERLIIPRLHLDAEVGSSVDAGPAPSIRKRAPRPAVHDRDRRPPYDAYPAVLVVGCIAKGDPIVIVSRGVRHLYRVSRSRVVAPSDWSVAREQGRERVILTTCTPRFSARARFVVFANVVKDRSRT